MQIRINLITARYFLFFFPRSVLQKGIGELEELKINFKGASLILPHRLIYHIIL